MNESQPIPSVSRKHPFRLARLVAFTCFLFGVVWLGVVLLFPTPDLARAARQATELQTIIRQQGQFSEVQVTALTNGRLSVFAPDELSTAAKAELEHLVAERAPDHAAPVSYLVPIPDAPASTNPK